jgi:hypothetical protein
MKSHSVPALLLCAALAHAQSAPAGKDKKNACGEPYTKENVCIDRSQPVVPLDMTLDAGKTLTVHVIGKTPWDKVSFDLKLSEVEDPSTAQLKSLFDFLAKVALGLPPISLKRAEPPVERKETFMASMRAEGIPEPFLSALSLLEGRQDDLTKQNQKRKTHSSRVKRASLDLAKADTSPAKSGDFRSALNNAIVALQAAVKNLETAQKAHPASLDIRDSAALLDRCKALVASDAFFELKAGQDQVQKRLAEAITRQLDLEADVAKLAAAEGAYADFLGLLEQVKREDKEWYEIKKVYNQPANRKAAIKISVVDRSSSAKEAKELASFNATWLKPAAVSMSLGFGFSFLAKEEFGQETVRDPSVKLTDPDNKALSYRTAVTRTRPIVIPMALVHVHPWAGRVKWFSVVGGAGVDAAGSSPTGELVAGLSFRHGAFNISPLAHFGRRKDLQKGFNVGEEIKQSFTPPTRDVWGAGFAFAVTYRLPLGK